MLREVKSVETNKEVIEEVKDKPKDIK